MTAIPSTSAVWHASPTLELLNSLSGGSLIGHLGIEFTEIGADSLTARMPVDECTRQPLGLLPVDGLPQEHQQDQADLGGEEIDGALERHRYHAAHRALEPLGLLHGGASVALAETLATWAATLTIDPDRSACVGIEINANHLRPVRDGWVTGVVRPVMQGRSTQVWEIRITDDAGRLVGVSRCTIGIVASR